MKTLISAFVIFILLTSPVFADGRHKHDRDMKGEGMGVMSHEQMMAMHKHMREMRSIMEKIKKETDQKKRHELMQNHMDSMKKGMHMMMSKNISMKQGKGHDMSSMKMGDRMDMMEQRMNMMQMMMGQMMEHEVEKKLKHDHK